MKWNEKFREAYGRVGRNQLARECGISPATAWRYDIGQTQPGKAKKAQTLPILDRLVSGETRKGSEAAD